MVRFNLPFATKCALFFGLALVCAASAATVAGAATRCTADNIKVLAQSRGDRIAFGNKTRMVMLSPTCGPIGTTVRRAGAKIRFLLVVEDLRATRQPGAIFDISLAASHGRGNHHGRMLGTLNFFNAHPAAAGKGRNVSYDVTTQLKSLARRDSLSRGVALAIAPMSTPERASDASAGAIKLVAQTD